MAAPIPNEALARGVRAAFGSAARIVVATPLAGDASNRRYVRLALSGGTAPPTVVAMLLDGARPISDELGGPDANAEVPFVNVGRYLAAHELPVPGVYLARSSEGFLLLEDVGDTTLWRAVEAAPARAAMSRPALSPNCFFTTYGGGKWSNIRTDCFFSTSLAKDSRRSCQPCFAASSRQLSVM